MTGVPAAELAAVPLLAGAPAEALETLAAHLSPRAFAPGEALVREGEPAHHFALLHSGTAEVTLRGAPVAVVGPGDVVGELALLRGVPRAATVRALDEVLLWTGDDHGFAALLEVPAVAERLARTARQRLAGLVRPVPVHLRDGSTVLLRPVLPGDRQRAAESLAGFSPETLYRRFLSGRRLTDAVLRYLTEVDYVHHFVWLALAGDLAVADARLVVETGDPAEAEVAFTVSDAYQGRGVGTVLMGALAVTAAELGVERFNARVLGDNRAMRRLLDRAAGERAPWRLDDPGVVTTVVPVPVPEAFLPDEQVVARLRQAVAQVVRTPG
jgi:CRP-like cAMP-binding protein